MNYKPCPPADLRNSIVTSVLGDGRILVSRVLVQCLSLARNGVLGNDDQGSEQIVDHSEVILRSLTTISNGKSACNQ
jgi:hypothetical protein